MSKEPKNAIAKSAMMKTMPKDGEITPLMSLNWKPSRLSVNNRNKSTKVFVMMAGAIRACLLDMPAGETAR